MEPKYQNEEHFDNNIKDSDSKKNWLKESVEIDRIFQEICEAEREIESSAAQDNSNSGKMMNHVYRKEEGRETRIID